MTLKKCTMCGWPITYDLCPKCSHRVEKEDSNDTEPEAYFGGYDTNDF